MISSAAFAQGSNAGSNNRGGLYDGVSAGFGSADIDTVFDPTSAGDGRWTFGRHGAANFDPDVAVIEVEYMVRPGLTVGLDYKYLDFGTELHLSDTVSCAVCTRPGDNRNVDVSAQVITARINLGF